jgi:tRNA (guanine37-N1)-methyltransferase
MNFHIVTLFPEMFDSYLNESILGRAIKNKKIKVNFVNPRKFVTGKYKKIWPDGNISAQVDDKPYAGGPGMVMRAEPIIKAVESTLMKIKNYELRIKNGKSNIKKQTQMSKARPCSKILVVNFIPSAEKFTTKTAKNISVKYTDVIMICGRYEGIDARVDKILKTTKISIGDYILTGGEIPAMILIDSIARQIKGVLGNFDSREEERVSSSSVYTRPEILIYEDKKYKVPSI